MKEKSTSDLDNVLKSTSKSSFKKARIENDLQEIVSLKDYLTEFISTHNLELNEIINNSQLSKNYAYGIFNGNRKNPSRDRMIAICRAMHMNYDETQRTLKIAKLGALYSKDVRDAAIITSINADDSVYDMNLFLDDNNLNPLETEKS